MKFVVEASRDARRSIAGARMGTSADLVVARAGPGVVWLGIRRKGSVRLTVAEADDLIDALRVVAHPLEEP